MSTGLEKKIVELLKSHLVEDKEEGCNLAIQYYYNEIISAIKHRFPKIRKEDAEDIAQDVGIIFYRNVKNGKYEEEGKTENYLRKIADLQTLKILGKRKRSLDDEGFVYYSANADSILDPQYYLQKDSFDKRRIDLFYQCVEKLPYLLNDIYWRYYEDCQKIAEISKEINKSKASIKVYLYNLRKNLADCVKRSKL